MSTALVEKMTTLRTQWEAKNAEAESLFRKADATADDYAKANTLYDARDSIGKEIDKYKSELESFDKVASRALDSKSYVDGLAPLISGRKDAAFKVTGSERAGGVVIDNESKAIADEWGAGVFGEKEWDAIASREYKAAFFQYVRKGERALDEFKTLQLGIDSQGGIFAPADVQQRLVARQPAPTRLAGLVTTVNTGRDKVIMPKLNGTDDRYTTGFRVTKTGELPSSATVHNVTDTNLFGTTEISIDTFMISGLLSLDQLEDSYFPLTSWLSDKFGETRDLLYEDMILNGSGTGEPIGLVRDPDSTDMVSSVVSGGASTLTADGLINLVYAIPEQYEMNNRFVMTKGTQRDIAKLKDSQNRYLLSSTDQQNGSIASARPDNLLGFGITRSAFMPTIGAGTFPIVFGDLTGYYMAQRTALSIQVVREKYVEQNCLAIVGKLRFGGKPVEPWKLRVQKVAAS